MAEDQFIERKRLTFEQAEGAEPLPAQLKLKEVSQELRATLWLVVHGYLEACGRRRDYSYTKLDEPWDIILRDMHVFRYHRMFDEFDDKYETLENEVKAVFAKGDYVEIFGWLQFVLRHPSVPSGFWRDIERVLDRCRAAYRVLERQTIVPFGSDPELKTIKRTFADLTAAEFHGARAHLRNAAAELTEGKWAASVRESIHAVESVARVLESSGEFSKALAKLQTKVKIHTAMRGGFEKLYGYKR